MVAHMTNETTASSDERPGVMDGVQAAAKFSNSRGHPMTQIGIFLRRVDVLPGKLLQLLLGWDFTFSVLLSAGIVLVYTYLGGLTSAIYNEVLQFFLIVAGFVPLVVLGLRDIGGREGLYRRLAEVAQARGFESGALSHSWQYMANPAQNPMGVEWFGLVMGLGFVLSFGYWCTDFLVVQRAMAADSMNAARRTPLIAAFPKMVFPFLVILPGMIAISATTRPTMLPSHLQCAAAESSAASGGAAHTIANSWEGLIPPKVDDQSCQPVVGTDGRVQVDYDLATPMMLMTYFPSGILGLGLCALMASFMSGMAGNTTAFNTVWTYDIYQAYINKRDRRALPADGTCGNGVRHPDFCCRRIRRTPVQQHHGSAAAGVRLRERAAVRDVHAGHVLEADDRARGVRRSACRDAGGGGASRADASGRRRGGLQGRVSRIVVHTYPSEMAQNFWTAIFAWTTCFVVSVVISLVTAPRKDEELKGLVYSLTPQPREDGVPLYRQPVPLAIVVLLASLVLNIIFW